MGVRVFAILNHKGGVGKTTTCFNLSCAYADMNYRVLAIDLDPQGHLTVSFGLHEPGLSGVDDLFLEHADITSFLRQARPGLDIVPAGYRLAEVEKLAAAGPRQARVLEKALKPVLGLYDVILLDCPPTSGLLNFNALYCASEVVIPVSSDYLALHGLSRLLRTLKSAESFMGREMKTWIVITRFIRRRRLSNQVKAKLVKYFPRQLLATEVRESAALAESPSFGKSVFEYDKRSNGAFDYARLADDLLLERVVGG